MKILRVTSTATARDSRFRSPLALRIRNFLAQFLFYLAAALLLTFCLSRIVTDQWLATQYVFWVPAWLYLVVLTIVLGIERVLSVRQLPRWKSPSWWMLLFCAAYTCSIALDAIPRRASSPPLPASIRIVHWNMSSPDLLNFKGTLADFPSCKAADIIVLGVTVPQKQLLHMVSGLGSEWTVSRIGVFAVASRFEIRDTNLFALGLEIGKARARESGFQKFYNEQLADRFGISRREFDLPDPGYVLESQIRTPDRDIVIRLIDLPSNPFRSRMEIANTASASINGLVKSKMLVAQPDVLIGDCNIPTGSASLKHLSNGMIAAETIADSGDNWPTWPRALPLLRIDHAWVRPDTTIFGYHTFDGGISDHRGQTITIAIPPSNTSRER